MSSSLPQLGTALGFVGAARRWRGMAASALALREKLTLVTGIARLW
jgi:hypothetical protein